MSTVTNIGSLIERRSGSEQGVRWWPARASQFNGSPAGTSVGLSPEEIAENFGHLSLAQVHAALAYYHSNREEIEAYLRDEAAADTQLHERSDSDASS